MKKINASILLIIWIISLCACGFQSGSMKAPVMFYYPWADLEATMKLNPDCTTIGSEQREISGNRDNLGYLLTLYFRGPLDASLRSPFPSGIAVVETETEEATLMLTLSDSFAQLKDMDLTIACTCLARTCFEMSDVQTVLIQTAAADDGSQVSISITRDNYLLEDRIPETTPTE